MNTVRSLKLVSRAVAAALTLTCVATSGVAQPRYGLSAQDKAQAVALAAKILNVIKKMPINSSLTAFEGVILGVDSGKPCVVIKAALAIVAATPGLPPAALAAGRLVAKACGPIGAVDQNNNLSAPGYSAGGGGSGGNGGSTGTGSTPSGGGGGSGGSGGSTGTGSTPSSGGGGSGGSGGSTGIGSTPSSGGGGSGGNGGSTGIGSTPSSGGGGSSGNPTAPGFSSGGSNPTYQ